MQAMADAHDTPARKAALVPAGRGTRRMANLVPFQRSASGTTRPARSVYCPTAMQAAGDTQDTAASEPPASGADRITHFVPFHASVSGPAALPTAMHAVTDAQETPARELPTVPGTLRAGVLAHLPWCQRSASVSPTPSRRGAEVPTAMHALATQDSPDSELSSAPLGFLVRRSAHLVPFQRSAIVDPVRCPLPKVYPTALHLLAEVQDTPAMKLDSGRGALRVRCSAQLLPFQRSATVTVRFSGWCRTTGWLEPTAVHALADVQETAVKVALLRICGVSHRLPFQRSDPIPRVDR
jgi:hypothetical protein